jgi:hypothetical protein
VGHAAGSARVQEFNLTVQHPSVDAWPADAGVVLDMTPNVPRDGAITGLQAIPWVLGGVPPVHPAM